MTPAETLAAARLSPVGPYATPRPEWLDGWCGPVEWLDTFSEPVGRWVVSTYGAGGMANEAPIERIRLDLRRHECRDLLCRHGCPAWARDVPAAVWAWVGGVEVRQIAWAPTFTNARCCAFSLGDRPAWWTATPGDRDAFTDPVSDGHLGWAACGEHGPETGDEARVCIILAALRAGCVLEEADGWCVPLVGGGVGWWPKNLETP